MSFIVRVILVLLVSSPALAQVVSVNARVETAPALTSGDAVDDPAIWVHPTDPTKSLIIGTDKQSGLFVYGLDGRILQRLDDGDMGNVDLRDNFALGGSNVTLVVANNRTTSGINVYVLNPTTGQLSSVGDGPLPTGIEVYGSCLFRSPKSGKLYSFVNDKDGVAQQWELSATATGKVTASKVREFDVGGQVEGCVADDELGHFYIGEETVGVWKYNAEPDGGTQRVQVDSTSGAGHLTADVEGLSIYYAPNKTGYLLVSSQGNNTFAIYERQGANTYLGSFRIADGAIDGVSDCDGVDVTNLNVGPNFPSGLVVAQDGSNPGANQNFKLVSWADVANAFTPKLVIDTSKRTSGAGSNPPPVGSPTTPGTGGPGSENVQPSATSSSVQTPQTFDGAKPDAISNSSQGGCSASAGATAWLSILVLASFVLRSRRHSGRL